ncbi:hypothetical protein F4802DRAFT_592685 [Xylaria palmicola]|nr:hypothetical protein F4802DRAFT_592685 [Xylaria palmicola]
MASPLGPDDLSLNFNRPFVMMNSCDYTEALWYCDECGAWYTSDEIKTGDCDDFTSTGECDERNVTTEESDADGLCDDCTLAREG